MNEIPVKRADSFSETRIDDEVVVMALASGEFFSLRETAKEVWEAIDGVRTRNDIVAALAAAHGVGAETIVGDIDAFLADLHAAGLIG